MGKKCFNKRHLRLSTKTPRFISNRSYIVDILKKISYYKSLLASPIITDEAKSEAKLAIKIYRDKMKEFQHSPGELVLSYKGVSASASVASSLRETYPELREQIINKLKAHRVQKRQSKQSPRSVSGVQYMVSGGVHTEPGAINKIFSEVVFKRFDVDKVPKVDTHHIGVEFEFFTPIRERRELAKAFIEEKLTQYVRIKTDGSIRPPNNNAGWEIAVIAEEKDIEDILKRVGKVFKVINAQANDSCGLHVHFDMRKRNKELAFHNLVSVQDILYNMVPTARRSNTYCVKQNSVNWNEASNSHYDGISRHAYNKHKTIEIRIHHGTTDVDETINWIKFLQRIVNYDGMLQHTNMPHKLFSDVSFDENVIKYVNNTIVKYGA